MFSSREKLFESLPVIEERIGYVFQNKNTLLLAFVHRSFYNEHRADTPEHNERLEFLGDSVLGLLIAKYLYESFPDESEGKLSHRKAFLVDAASCAGFIAKLGLAEFLLLGRGEKMQEGTAKESIRADLFEALLAAVYLDGGFMEAEKFFWSHFSGEIAGAIEKPGRNWKADLQEILQKGYQKLPVYKVLGESGPEHNKQFTVGVFVEEELLGSGSGGSKKEAEQQAAKEAIEIREKRNNG